MQFVLSNAFREAKYVLIKINVYSRNHLVFIFFFLIRNRVRARSNYNRGQSQTW